MKESTSVGGAVHLYCTTVGSNGDNRFLSRRSLFINKEGCGTILSWLF